MSPITGRSLATLRIGETAIIRSVSGVRAVARRLMEMGLVPGTSITVRRVAPLGDPVELRVRDYALSIRLAEALRIGVE